MGALLRPVAAVDNESQMREGDVSSPIPAFAIMGVLIGALLVFAPWWRGSSYDRFLEAAPPGLTEAARVQLQPGTRTLVHQPWGSWFEFAVPDIPVFVDSRIEIVPADIWHDYGEVGFAGSDWKGVLEKWNVQAIVADANWDLYQTLKGDHEEWRMLYEDADGALFERA
jgi:hypothetical protein